MAMSIAAAFIARPIGLGCGGLHLVHIAGHQLDLGLLEGGAAFILEGHPADDVDGVALFGGDDVVIGLPGQAAGDVGEFGVELGGLGGVDRPRQGRVEDGVVAERGKDRLAGQQNWSFLSTSMIGWVAGRPPGL